ncbi:hypothetical protein D9M71_710410 [compost metagenome]
MSRKVKCVSRTVNPNRISELRVGSTTNKNKGTVHASESVQTLHADLRCHARCRQLESRLGHVGRTGCRVDREIPRHGRASLAQRRAGSKDHRTDLDRRRCLLHSFVCPRRASPHPQGPGARRQHRGSARGVAADLGAGHPQHGGGRPNAYRRSAEVGR